MSTTASSKAHGLCGATADDIGLQLWSLNKALGLMLAATGPELGRAARRSLRLLEEKVVERHIVERASDNTIGRTLKKTFSNRIASSNG